MSLWDMGLLLQIGCADVQPENWVNIDAIDWGQGYVLDVRDGLPFPDDSAVLAVSNHALQMLTRQEIVPLLAELRRVIRPGGWLRLLVPDLMAAFMAYFGGDHEHFQIADELESGLDGKLCTYITQAGSTRSVFTTAYLAELLRRGGWANHLAVTYGETASGFDVITTLDSRPAESIVMEAW